MIAHNRGRLGKTLWTQAGDGDKIMVRALWDAEEEARWVGDEIEALQRNGHALGEIAILVRAGFQTREFEERFIALALPYRVIGGPRFYERQEIRDALAYLRLVNQPADDLAFERILNTPRRGIGSATLQQLHGLARDRRLPLVEAARLLIAGDRLRPAGRNALAGFVATLDRWRDQAGRVSHTDLVQIVLDESGYTGMWQAERSPDAAGRLENLKELVVAMAEFENLGGFLEHVSLVMDNAADSGGDMVNLMTLHSAKGLEFDSVFLPGWEDGLFPNQRAMEENGLAALEEERRLAYVGLTRARHRGYVSFAANRRIHGQWQSAMRSRFVDELPSEHTEIVAEPGLQPGAARAAGLRRRLGQRRPAGRRRSQPVGRAPPSDADRKRFGSPPRRRDPPGRRVFGRRPRLPPEIRLRRDHRRRGQQARHPFRARRRQKSHGRLRRTRLTGFPTYPKRLSFVVPAKAGTQGHSAGNARGRADAIRLLPASPPQLAGETPPFAPRL